MKYGKVEDPNGIDFNLPEDHPRSFIPKESEEEIRIYSGGTMWNIPKWKGKVYPEKTPVKDFIEAYGKQFDTIELNATHYRTPSEETVRKWSNAMPEHFRFCPKWPQSITHYRRFRNCEAQTEEFLTAIHAFGEKLGQCFIQLPPNFSPGHSDALIEYLQKLPDDLPLSIEFRHPDWFQSKSEAETVWELLKEKGYGSVISATAGRRDALHMRMTNSVFILRYGGYDLHSSDEYRISQWSDRIAQWKEKGLKKVYLLIHQSDSIMTPETIALFQKELARRAGIHIQAPRIQQSLF
jgi:uncharacterized protein YecE (DUF72 family)